MKLEATLDKLIIEPRKRTIENPSKVIIPDSVEQSPFMAYGEIVSKGPDCESHVSEGDIVAFSPIHRRIRVEGDRDVILLPESEVYAIVREEDLVVS